MGESGLNVPNLNIGSAIENRMASIKMTQAEFQKWTDYAIAMRNKALDGDVEYDEYVRDMKK